MKLAYISGRYTAPNRVQVEQNISVARLFTEKYLRLNFAVFCPHTNYDGMEDLGYELLMKADLEILSRCDVVVMIPNWKNSYGAVREHKLAKQLRKHIIYEGGEIP